MLRTRKLGVGAERNWCLGLKTLQNLAEEEEKEEVGAYGLEAGWKVSKAGAWRGLKERLSQDRPFPSKAIRRDEDDS